MQHSSSSLIFMLLRLFLGHYDVSERSISISTKDSRMEPQPYTMVWTFDADSDQRIQFNFSHEHSSYNIIEIGDGPIKSSSTRLAKFKPNVATPSDVVSVSCSAWLSIHILP